MKAKLLSLLAVLLVTTAAFAEDIYYCRGGLVGIGDWAASDKYPLTKGEDGIYSGEVDMVGRTDLFDGSSLGWGNRVDLFFDKNNTGSTFACANGTDRFIAPGLTDWRPVAAGNGNTFQCVGGKYMVYLDIDNNRVRFEPIEPAYLDEVIVYGMVKDCHWQVLGENAETGVKARLKHQGDGIYTGQITFDESTDGMSDFCVRATFNGSGNEGRYSSSVANLQLLPGVNYACNRYYGDRNWRVPTGTYNITFDFSHQTIRVNTPDDPDRVVSQAYAELEAAIKEAQDRFPGIDLSSAQEVLNNSESTDEQLTEAKNSLPALQLAHLLGLMNKANEGNPVDATYLVKGAACSNSDGWGGTTMTYSNGIMTASNKDFNTHQELTSLPNGVYRVSLKGTSRYGAGNVYYTQATQLNAAQRNLMLYATADGVRMNKPFGDIHDTQYASLTGDGATSVADFSKEGWFSPTDVNTARLWMRQGRYADNHVMAYVSDGTLTIGLTRTNHQDGDVLYADDWGLTYYGDGQEALALVANDVEEANDNYQESMAQASVKDALEAAIAQAKSADNLAEAYKALAEAEAALRKSAVAYISYQNKIESIKAQLADQKTPLTGPAATLLNNYLGEAIAPNETYPHGTANYIMQNGNLNEEELAAEEAYADELLGNALKGNIEAGADITSLFTNIDWTQKDWAGWTVEKQEDANASSSSSDGQEGMKVASWYNWASGSITQTLEGMPDGIYALEYNGFVRTGQPHQVQSDDDINTFAIVGDMRTPIMGVYDGALPLEDAVEGENCSGDDYKGDASRFPGSANGASIAFRAGRYRQTAYGMAQDGKLTIGWINDGYPNYWEDWFAVGNIKVTYLGADEKAADAMVEAAKARGEGLTALYNFREETRGALVESMESGAKDFAAKCAQAEAINKYCNEARVSVPIYAALESAAGDLNDRIEYAYKHNGISQEKMNQMNNEVGTVQGNVLSGAYSDEEAENLTQVYKQKAADLIPMQVRGGLEGVGNWQANDMYLLFKNDNGIYEGNVTMHNADDLSATNSWWGNRGDLFFVDNGNFFYGSVGSPQGYIVPADTASMRLQKKYNGVQSPFQLQGGKYHVLLDMDNLSVKFQCTEEYWMDSLYCVGTLEGFRYDESFDAWKTKTGLYPLHHTGHGLYKGKVTVEAQGEGEGEELGLLAVMSSFNSGKSEGRYASAAGAELKHGITHQAPRSATSTNTEKNFFKVDPGEWLVTFDMNNGTIRLNRADDPDYAEEGVVEENVIWYAAGGLDGTGNWEETTKYPLVKNKDGKYEGVVKFTDEALDIDPESPTKRWGNRSDLFFKSSLGMYIQPAEELDNDQKFITPAKNAPIPVNTKNDRNNGIKTFQAVAGTYKVLLDDENLTMQFECLEEKWLPAVYVRGTLKDFRWKHAVQEDSLNVLRHVGHGVYQGVINLEEDNSVTHGKFAIKATFNDGGSEAIYNPIKDATPIEVGGEAVPVFRYCDGGKCLLAPIGKLFVTFDMNNEWVKLTDPDNPDAIEKIGLSTLPRNAQVGIYTLDGRKVYSGMSQWNTATPGIYIMVKDGQAKKVLVK